MNTTKLILASALTAMALVCPVRAQNGTNSSERVFLNQAAEGSLHEVALGNLAQTKSQNALVQQFGARLVEDHTMAYAQAVALAQELGFSSPTNLSRHDLKNYERFSTEPGALFDSDFINFMIRNHIKDIQTYEDAAQASADADVRAYARAQLPVLMQHLVTALQIRESLGSGSLGIGIR